MINRTAACIRHIALIASALLYVTVLFIDYSPIWRGFFTLLLIIAACVAMKNQRCPYCNRYRLKYNPLLDKEIGYCSACGKHIEYRQ